MPNGFNWSFILARPTGTDDTRILCLLLEMRLRESLNDLKSLFLTLLTCPCYVFFSLSLSIICNVTYQNQTKQLMTGGFLSCFCSPALTQSSTQPILLSSGCDCCVVFSIHVHGKVTYKGQRLKMDKKTKLTSNVALSTSAITNDLSADNCSEDSELAWKKVWTLASWIPWI